MFRVATESERLCAILTQRFLVHAGGEKCAIQHADVVILDGNQSARYYRGRNSRAILVRLPAYASTDDERPRGCRDDALIAASAGLFLNMGQNRSLLGVEASFSPLHLPSSYGACFAAYAAVCAIHDRRYGEYIEVPLASALSEALVHNSIEFPLHETYMSRRAIALRRGEAPVSEKRLDELLDPFFRKYTCNDKGTIYLVCPGHVRHQLNALCVLGVTDEVCEILPFLSLYDDQPGFGIGNRLTDEQSRRVLPILQQAFLSNTSLYWETRLGEAQVPAIRHRSCDEWMSSQHAKESGLITEGEDPIGPVCWFHSVGSTDNDFRDQKLSQLKVLDLTNVIAGPTIGSMLARMGADIIKIDPTQPQYGPMITIVYGIVTNVGKKSILLDIATEKGRQAFDKLLCSADVVVMNSTNDALERLHITPLELQKINPDVILMQFDAWGGPTEQGPFKNFIGYDDNVQACIGIQTRFGGSYEDAEEHAHVGTIDVIAGVAGALATVAALLHRKKGSLVKARASLAAVGQYLQFREMLKPSVCLGRGKKCVGFHDRHRIVKCTDGYAYVISNESIPENVSVKELEALDADVERLISIEGLKQKYVDADEKKSFRFLRQRHECGVLLICAPVAVRWRHVRSNLSSSPKYGEHTMDVLKSIRMASLLFSGEAKSSLSRAYFPCKRKCDSCDKAAVVSCQQHAYCLECARSYSLSVALKLFAQQYNAWRRGSNKGARDLHMMRSNMRRSHSLPCLRARQSISLTNAHSSISLVKGSNASQALDLPMPERIDS